MRSPLHAGRAERFGPVRRGSTTEFLYAGYPFTQRDVRAATPSAKWGEVGSVDWE